MSTSRSRRFSPIPLALRYRMPPTKWTLLDLAAAEGRAMRHEPPPPEGETDYDRDPGSFERLRSRERPIGVVVTDTHRRRILEKTGASKSLWNRATAEWVKLGLAHRCDRAHVFILVEPAPTCWRCSATLPSAPISAAPDADQRRSDADQRRSGHESGDASRDEQGDAWGDEEPDVEGTVARVRAAFPGALEVQL